MVPCQRAGENDRSGPFERLLGALLAVAALLVLPAVHGLELHHADHRGGWIAAEPAGPQLVPSATGASTEPGCWICLASGQARSGALAPSGGSPVGEPAALPLRAGACSALLPIGADAFAAGPRAPPHA